MDRLRNIEKDVWIAIVMVVIAIVCGYKFFLQQPMTEKKVLTQQASLGKNATGNQYIASQADAQTKKAGEIAAPSVAPTTSTIKKEIKAIIRGKNSRVKKGKPLKVNVSFKEKDGNVLVNATGSLPDVIAFYAGLVSGARFTDTSQLRAGGMMFRLSSLRLKYSKNQAKIQRLKIVPVRP